MHSLGLGRLQPRPPSKTKKTLRSKLTLKLNHAMSLIPFLLATTLLAVTPGPGTAYVVSRTVSCGRTATATAVIQKTD
jgi:hypothetical protein